jgi:hypothetical protein
MAMCRPRQPLVAEGLLHGLLQQNWVPMCRSGWGWFSIRQAAFLVLSSISFLNPSLIHLPVLTQLGNYTTYLCQSRFGDIFCNKIRWRWATRFGRKFQRRSEVMAKRRGNPNWGKPATMEAVAPTITEFEQVVQTFHLRPEGYVRSARLREWANRNKNSKYVPETLLKAWGFEVESTL